MIRTTTILLTALALFASPVASAEDQSGEVVNVVVDPPPGY
jgi:hypothetical protein